MVSKLPKIILFFLIVFAPLAFGTVEPWSYAVMEILTALGLFFFLVSHYLFSSRSS